MDNTDNSISEKEVMKTGISHIEEVCPAFHNGCPFNKPELKDLVEQAKKCPALKDECMFKSAKSIQEVYEKLSQIPDVTENSPHKRALTEVLKIIHSVSSELKWQFGDCPVFKSPTGCPFKTVCSDGKPLLVKLDNFNWDSVIHNATVQIEKDFSAGSAGDGTSEADTSSVKLSTDLKEGTKVLHREASHSRFIKEFMRGRVEKNVFREMIASFYFIYKALEEEFDKLADHSLFGPIHFPNQLARMEGLKKDLRSYYGENWENEIECSDVCKRYISRIQEVVKTNPTLMISHHYTRYMGDLSGGQIMKRLIQKHYFEPGSDVGTQFFVFDNISDPQEFKAKYRSTLDGISMDHETVDAIVEEAKVAYLLNIELFNELDVLAGLGKKAQKPITETVEKIQSASMRSKDVESGVDILKVIAAVMLVIAVLVGFTVNMWNK